MVEAQTDLTTMFLPFMLICSVFITHNVGVAASIECLAPNEYQAGTECCPECPPGEHLVKDCIHGSITECSTCPNGTFQAGHTKEQQCSACTKCEAGLGLKVKKSCSSTSDAVCEVLDGFFCSDSTDAECREHGPETGLGAGIISGVILGMALMGLIIAIIHRKKRREWRLTSKMETLSQELSQGCCLTGIYSPAPTGDQQEHPTTTPAAAMDDHDGDQSLGPAPPSSPHIMDLCCSHNLLRTLRLSPSGQTEDRISVPLSLSPPSPSPSRPTPLSLVPPSPSRSQSTLLTLVPPSPSQSTPLSLGSRDGNEHPPHAICPWICLVAGELCHFTRHCVG